MSELVRITNGDITETVEFDMTEASAPIPGTPYQTASARHRLADAVQLWCDYHFSPEGEDYDFQNVKWKIIGSTYWDNDAGKWVRTGEARHG